MFMYGILTHNVCLQIENKNKDNEINLGKIS